MPSSPWSAPIPLPPPSGRPWTDDELRYLQQIIKQQLERKTETTDFIQDALDSLIKRLASSKGVKRFETAANYARQKRGESLSYSAWIDQIIEGILLYYPQITAQQDTLDGPMLALQPTLADFAASNYRKIFQRYPPPDILDDLIARTLLCLHENYYFDVALEPWLWQTTRHLLLNDIRRENKDHTVALDEVPDPFSPSDFSKNHIHHDLLRDSIKKIHNQRYRIILQLIYIYQLNNTELAAFFGVPVPRATTWLSRARSALRKQIQPHQLFN